MIQRLGFTPCLGLRWRRRFHPYSLVGLIALVFLGCGSQLSSGSRPIDRVSLAPGDERNVTLAVHCGYETLELDINGSSWTTKGLGVDEAGNPAEPGWPPTGGTVELTLRMVDDTTLVATAPGTGITHTYHPDPSPAGCS
jgi:hypothetical protein